MIDKFQETFREEAEELLETLQASLLELESNSDSPEHVSAVFRAMHTIKGSAAMFGFHEISEFAHSVETMLDAVRAGTLSASSEMIDITLASRDHILDLLHDNVQSSEVGAQLVERVQQLLQAPTGEPVEAPKSDALVPTTEPAATDGAERTYTIAFRPHEGYFQNGSNPVLLLADLAVLGTVQVQVRCDEVPALEQLVPDHSYLSWNVRVTTRHQENEIRDVFLFVEGQSDIDVQLVETIPADDGLLDQGRITDAAALGDARSPSMSDRSLQEAAAASVRVPAEKLDGLVDLVGELVTLQARLDQTVETETTPELTAINEGFERLISDLRDRAMSMRMVPIATGIGRFRRLVRDLSSELGKQVGFEIEGGETELDKSVMDRMLDPLVHIVRNSVDHGIEAPQTRHEAGKSEQGLVKLIARHVGASVEIRVSDDGAGLDPEQILKRAVERGLVERDANLSEAEIYDLVFHAGFSTAAAVTAVSGRGVGMDVVRRQVQALGGTVRVESQVGQGASTIMSIPLTLAIIDGLLVRVDATRYVVPLANVIECVEYQPDASGNMQHRERVLPIWSAREHFGSHNDAPALQQVVIVRTAIGPVGVIVDAVIGGHQTVIKNLGRLYNAVGGISGATIMGDGEVALVLDVQRLVARRNDGSKTAQP